MDTIRRCAQTGAEIPTIATGVSSNEFVELVNVDRLGFALFCDIGCVHYSRHEILRRPVATEKEPTKLPSQFSRFIFGSYWLYGFLLIKYDVKPQCGFTYT